MPTQPNHEYDSNQVTQLMNGLWRLGWKPLHLTWLGQNHRGVASLILAVLDGHARIVPVETDGPQQSPWLRLLDEVVIPELSGVSISETFESSGVFPGGVGGCKEPLPPSHSTPETSVTVNELIAKGRYQEFFGGLGKKRRKFTQAQVIWFCRHRYEYLRVGGRVTFFELEGGLVACASFVGHGLLKVEVHYFEGPSAWESSSKHRVAVPQ